ncbi:Nuclear pore complex, Nup160 component [Handroanthus impetiginosus]|uniref:Nuclear pore complex, Nup160 component n=1 Tax=Handroanthus impetiginosus TaxID=429701 RepID=A0A2G9I824_9LAMI|nr:Nuclear pore complex, Nup160 component [Handroanthus impetiginosus]
MGSSSGWRMAGMEVPLLSTDSIEWRQVSVPSTSSTSTANTLNHPLSKDFGSCCAIGNPPSYFIWKTSKSQSNLLEILELCSHKEISRIGLRLVFPDALFPFAFVCKDEINFATGNHLLLYTLTISGVAYLIRLRGNFDYGTSSLVPTDEIFEYSTQLQPYYGEITAVAATAGYLLIGRSDGSIGCFQLGMLDPTASGFVSEFRDDAGFGRLWGILSSCIGCLNCLLFGIRESELQPNLPKVLLFLAAFPFPALTFPMSLAWTHTHTVSPCDVGTETIFLYGLQYNLGDKILLSLEPSSKQISLGEGGPIDVKLTSSKVWILKEEGLIMQDFFCSDVREGLAHYYTLQETYIADLLFQSSEHSSDDLLWLAYSAFSSAKEDIAPFVSSVFLRSLLFPGVHCNAILRQTLGDYNKHFTDSEFGSLTVDGLKSEIMSLIEHQGGSESPVSILQCWKNFCARYVNNWCKYNAAFGLLMDPLTGAIGLVRNNTISLCRGLEDVEHIIYGSFEEQSKYINPGLNYSGDELDRKILFELLQCIRSVSQQLGKASSAIFYESLLSSPNISSEEVVPRFLKILETGYSSSTAGILMSELGADTAWEKELLNHKNLRKFSANMFLSLHSLCHKANSWGKVLDVVESYLKFLVPHKIVLNLDAEATYHINCSAVVQSTSQIAKLMFESAFDVLMLLSYMISISGQINMSHDDVSRVKLELVPMIQEIITEWHIIHFFGTTPLESPAIEDFSYQLSSLQIDGNMNKRLWNAKLGKSEFSLAFILLLSVQSSSGEMGNLSFSRLPNPSSLISLSQEFTSWIIWGRSRKESSVFFSNSVDLALVLLRHGQYNATEYLLTLVDAHSRKEKIFESLQAVDEKFLALFHLLGCCLVAQTQHGLHGPVKDRKVGEAVRCFFRAASTEGSSKALQSLPPEAGWLQVDFSSSPSAAGWKIQYYQWVMQLFEQYNLSEAACQFALAALEQVDEALGTIDSSSRENLGESVTTVRGRLWANVFKLTLDLNNYHDAYCAIISNPDEESKNICLRRFIIVLYERGAVKILCDGQLPLIGLVEKVERELAWKAERCDISAKPNPFKLLYAFEMHRHNWRRAAGYMYLYSARLRAEAAVKDHQLRSSTLHERLNGLSAAINALHLVHPAYAWIDGPVDEISLDNENYPNKKARITKQEQSPPDDALPQKLPSYLDVEKLEKEFVLTSAEHLLSLVNIKWTSTGIEKPSAGLIDLLVESNLYDMAFTVILKFWKGSGLKRELERVFIAMALKCCPSRPVHALHGAESCCSDKYRAFHPRLPLIVAGTLLSADSQIELPLWLVRHFKDLSCRNMREWVDY